MALRNTETDPILLVVHQDLLQGDDSSGFAGLCSMYLTVVPCD